MIFQGGDGPTGQGDLFQQVDAGSIPSSPLHPKQLIVKVIPNTEAAKIWKEKHYLHRDVPGASIQFGVFAPSGEIVGAICFSAWVVWAPEGGRPDKWELRRLWLDDRCQKNSESRVVGIALRTIQKLCPHVKQIIAYADPEAGHKGGIYKAIGFRYEGMTEVSEGNSYGNTKEVSRSSKHKYIYQMKLRKQSEISKRLRNLKSRD